MRKKIDITELAVEAARSGVTAPLDLIRLMGGKSKKVEGKTLRAPDSMLAVYKNRFTYTFIMNDEVASIHFDDSRNEIFFKGHNIRNLELTEAQKNVLETLHFVLEEDNEGKKFLSSYFATLERVLADK
jgi:hypothetical protein